MSSAIDIVTQYLKLASPDATRFYISCFRDYAQGFLQSHPHVLDPDFAQIRARVCISVANRLTSWVWTEDPQVKARRGQEEHAAAFVLRVMHYTGCCATDEDIHFIHNRLCNLQSVWLGNGVYFEDWKLEGELKWVLTRAMEEV